MLLFYRTIVLFVNFVTWFQIVASALIKAMCSVSIQLHINEYFLTQFSLILPRKPLQLHWAQKVASRVLHGTYYGTSKNLGMRNYHSIKIN
jgi:hypothetical protein